MTGEIKRYLKSCFDRIETATLIGSKEVLTAEEAAVFTGYTTKGIYAMTSEKRIPHYKKNGKLYFRKQELVEWMTQRKVLTDDEINAKAATYVATH